MRRGRVQPDGRPRRGADLAVPVPPRWPAVGQRLGRRRLRPQQLRRRRLSRGPDRAGRAGPVGREESTGEEGSDEEGRDEGGADAGHQEVRRARGEPVSRPSTAPQGTPANDKNLPARRAGGQTIGRFRRGLTTKTHLAADLRCRPVPAYQPGPARRFAVLSPLIEAIGIGRRGLGRPRQRPGRAMGDKAYSPAGNRAWVLAAQPWHQSGHPCQGGPEETPPQPRLHLRTVRDRGYRSLAPSGWRPLGEHRRSPLAAGYLSSGRLRSAMACRPVRSSGPGSR